MGVLVQPECERMSAGVGRGRAPDRDGRLGLSITNKDWIPVSLVGIFSTNVRLFSLLMSL